MKLRLAIFFTLIAATNSAVYFVKKSPATATETTGDAAIAQLKTDGSYDSLAAAMTAARYRVEPDGERFSADNPAQQLAARFEPDGTLNIASAEHSTALRVASFGRGDDQTEVGAGRWTASESRAENRRADVGLTEYVENRPEGVEQGFIIDSKPSGDAPLSLILKTSGGLKASASDDGQRVILKNESGAEVIAYEKLRVWDANNLELTARMSTTDGAIKLEVEDAAAVYPLTIDPTFVRSATLIAPDGETLDNFGSSVAISGDTAVIGAPGDNVGQNNNQGSVYVFVRANDVWTQQVKLLAGDGQATDFFGIDVAVSGDTIVVGAYSDQFGSNLNQGSAYVFVRNGNAWQPEAKLSAADGADGDFFGQSVSISIDTIVIGSPFATIGGSDAQGAAYVYTRSGGAWTQQAKLTASDGATNDTFGSDVSISGSTLLVGAPGCKVGSNLAQGAAYAFTRGGTVWTPQAKLTATDGAAFVRFGSRIEVKVTLNGTLAVVGATEDSPAGFSQAGAAYVFQRSQAGFWTQAQKLISPSPLVSLRFGDRVAISPLGNQIAITDRKAIRSIYVYRLVNSSWARQQTVVQTGNGSTSGGDIDLSNDTLLSGTPFDRINGNPEQGAALVYTFGQKPFDFDGDGKTDFSIYRPNGNQWWFNRSSDLVTNVVTLGTAGDKLVPGDYTGDGKVDQAVWRPSTGFWFVVRSNDGSFFSFPFGASGDIPAPADYDGDGLTDPAVFRPSNATWYISRSSDSGTTIATFGASTDKPVPADYDGDLKADIAIFRPNGPNGAEWWYSRSSNGQTSALQFGAATDKAVPGDFTGDGKADIAFFRPSNGNWFVLRSEDNSFFSFPFGAVGDIPAPGDYDGDGRFDAAVYRPSIATWYASTATAGTLIAQFGASGDQPVPNAFVP